MSRGCLASSKAKWVLECPNIPDTPEAVSRGYSGPPTSNLRIFVSAGLFGRDTAGFFDKNGPFRFGMSGSDGAGFLWWAQVW